MQLQKRIVTDDGGPMFTQLCPDPVSHNRLHEQQGRGAWFSFSSSSLARFLSGLPLPLPLMFLPIWIGEWGCETGKKRNMKLSGKQLQPFCSYGHSIILGSCGTSQRVEPARTQITLKHLSKNCCGLQDRTKNEFDRSSSWTIFIGAILLLIFYRSNSAPHFLRNHAFYL